MAAVAIGRGVGLFAKAEVRYSGCLGGKDVGHNASAGVFVRAVAKRLGGGMATRAPCILFSGFQVDFGRAIARAFCVAHVGYPLIHRLNDA